MDLLPAPQHAGLRGHFTLICTAYYLHLVQNEVRQCATLSSRPCRILVAASIQ